MALTTRLEFRQSQALVMTPQLMQAIKLLQLSNLDLMAYVEEELEKNPLLERISDDEGPGAPAETPDTSAASEAAGRTLSPYEVVIVASMIVPSRTINCRSLR